MPIACTIFLGTHTYIPRKEFITIPIGIRCARYLPADVPWCERSQGNFAAQMFYNEELRRHHLMVPIHTTNNRGIVFRQWGRNPRMARPMPCPIMVSSRMPVSEFFLHHILTASR
jgi:hypothetical protein